MTELRQPSQEGNFKDSLLSGSRHFLSSHSSLIFFFHDHWFQPGATPTPHSDILSKIMYILIRSLIVLFESN